MKSKAIICAIAAASFSFASLSFADNDNRRGPGNGDSHRSEQRGPMGRDGHDSGPRNFDQRNQRHDNGSRGGDGRSGSGIRYKPRLVPIHSCPPASTNSRRISGIAATRALRPVRRSWRISAPENVPLHRLPARSLTMALR